MSVAVCYILHDDFVFLGQSIRSFAAAGPVLAFVSRIPWHGEPGEWDQASGIAQREGAEVVFGAWRSELEHRQAAFAHLIEQGFTHALIPDGDEIVEPRLLEALVKVAVTEMADRVYVEWDTYWKSAEYVIRPRERFTPCILIDLRVAKPVGLRNFEGGRPLFLSSEHGIIHHLSYAGPDERIWRKINTWGHANEVRPGWWEHVWTRWDGEKTLRNLHPTHPDAYQFAEHIHVPEILRSIPTETQRGHGDDSNAVVRTPVSVVIPLHGGEEDIRLCLESLERCNIGGDLVCEAIVVDNASPDNAAAVAESFPLVHLLRNETNTGFAAACNQGAHAALGGIVLFLNSDTVVPRVGLLRLIEAVTSSGSVGAAGPYTNYAGHGQQIDPTYTSPQTLDLFAEDFAQGRLGCEGPGGEDREVDMLVGFCLAVKQSVLTEVTEKDGAFFDERFGMGLFEDNDLCYRIRRAGYRLLLVGRSYVHHSGSKTLGRVALDAQQLLARNHRLFVEKWRDDLESGYASHLSGLGTQPYERIIFDAAKHPDLRLKRVKELARRADISLTMIVKNEERVLADCLASAKPFFKEIIVVDTGSTDRTVAIAQEYGAKVFHFPWTESFAEARTEALKHATGRWVFWMDADDTLPFQSGEALLQETLNASHALACFIVPVQFTDDGSEMASSVAGTRVDHVKLFRNMRNMAWEGRIHEQILPSLRQACRAHGRECQLSRSKAVVLHSGYDTSAEGQARKRQRDMRLLLLDYRERPRHPFVLFNIGMTFHYTGEYKRAVRWLNRCIRYSPTEDSHVRKAYDLLAISWRRQHDDDKAAQVLEEGLRIFQTDAEMHFHSGQLFLDRGNACEDPAEREALLRQALNHFQQVLQDRVDDHFTSLDRGILGFKTHHNLGTTYLALGQYPPARDALLRALEEAPTATPSAHLLSQAATDFGDFATASRMLQVLLDIEGASEGWVQASLRYADAIGGLDNTVAWLQRAITQYPQAIAPRLAYSRILLQHERTGEAEPLLKWLAEHGVVEAARNLGVMHVQRGDYLQALTWTNLALSICPTDEIAAEQAARLREALGLEDAVAESLPLPEALQHIAVELGLDAAELQQYAAEDLIGGYQLPHLRHEMQSPWWPGGSVWEVEGKILYAVARATKPKTIVEIGSLIGCSASHFAEACRKNGQGIVYAVDPFGNFGRVSPTLMEYIRPVCQDVFDWTPPEQIDLIFEDGTHEPGFTQSVLEKLKPHLAPGAVVWSHDAASARFPHVFQEFAAVMGSNAVAILPAPSDCGLAYARADESDGSIGKGMQALRKIHPFPSRIPDVPPNDHGWLAPGTAAALRARLSPSTGVVIELGSWLGKSARHIADCAPHATIIAVDHWQGSEENHRDPDCKHLLSTLYETFVVNCWSYRNRIVPVRLSTTDGMDLISGFEIRPDLVYIDAAHDYESVKSDILRALSLFPSAAIVGDDWPFDDVKRAVMDVVATTGMQTRFGSSDSAWWIDPMTS